MSSSTNKQDLASLIEKVPRDPDGFSPSFAVTDTANWKPFLDHYGYVVVQILTPQECDTTVSEFFSEVQRRQKTLMPPGSYKKLIDPSDVSSFEDENWFGTGRFKASFPAVAPQALRNRTHPNLYAFYSQLLGTPRIYSHVDVYGIMRPTKNLEWRVEKDSNSKDQNDDDDSKAVASSSSYDIEYIDKPEWKQSLPPHIDKNPWSYVREVIQEKKYSPFYQGVLALVDCDDSIGGFSIAPCSARHLDKWVQSFPAPPKDSPAATRNHYDLPPNDPWHKLVQHVPIRKGELVIWDSGSVHNNYPNSCDQFRLVMYTRCCALDAKPVPQHPEDVAADLPSNYKANSVCDPPDLKTASAAAGLSKLQMQMLQVIPYEKDKK